MSRKHVAHRSAKKPLQGIDVETSLEHFAIVTYLVDPDRLRPHVHERFQLDCINNDREDSRALVSVVPFLDRDFRFAKCPWPKWAFGQTNYRAYVLDTETGEHCVWFFGTVLDSISVAVPRHVWKLPWHRGRIRFGCDFDEDQRRFRTYWMTATGRWAPAELELEDSGNGPACLEGFPDLETGLVLLTNPLVGYFYRRDGRLGSYRIWHDRLQMTLGRVIRANFPLLERLGLVKTGDQSSVHSVLLQKSTDFAIYLPPVAIE